MLLIKILTYNNKLSETATNTGRDQMLYSLLHPCKRPSFRSMCQASYPDKLENTKGHRFTSRYWKGLINFKVLRQLPGRVRVHTRLHFCPLWKEGKREEQRKQNRKALLRSRLSTLKMQSFLSGEQYMHATHSTRQSFVFWSRRRCWEKTRKCFFLF